MARTLVLFLLSAASLAAQSFEAAFVKRNPAAPSPATRMRESAGRVDFVDVPLQWVVRRAYQVQANQIVGPGWLTSECYGITATYPPNTPGRERNLMFQNLLADRFQFVAHKETKDMAGYVLIVGKSGSKLTAVDGPATGFQMKNDGIIRHFHSQTTLAALANFLSDQLSAPVIDQSGLKGTFEITLDFVVSDQGPDEQRLKFPLLPAAVESQIGLKLDAQKVPREMVIIDHAEKIPTEN